MDFAESGPARSDNRLWLPALFGGAGRLDWTRGWIYVGASLVALVAIEILVRCYNPAVLEARSHWRHKNTEASYKVFLAIFAPSYFLQPAIAGLDAVRFGWSSIPFWTVYPGLASRSRISAGRLDPGPHPHAESTVRIQTDRGHAVISAGPNQMVRHPMYVGIILGYVGGPRSWARCGHWRFRGRDCAFRCPNRSGRSDAAARVVRVQRILRTNALPAGARAVVTDRDAPVPENATEPRSRVPFTYSIGVSL